MTRETPNTGDTWKHFKGNCYMILAVGHHSETKEQLVVYYDLTGKNSTLADPCIRPLDKGIKNERVYWFACRSNNRFYCWNSRYGKIMRD